MAKRTTGRNPAQGRSQVSRVPPPKPQGSNPGPVPSPAALAAQTRAKPGQQAAGVTRAGGNVPVPPKGRGRSSVAQKPGKGIRQGRRGAAFSSETTAARTRGGR